MSLIKLQNIGKKYPNSDKYTIENLNLEINEKDFVVLVGPSGCGKSTTLRMIAGLEDVSEGEILFEDQVMNDVDPSQRGISMVFQNYALYPHMSVAENMGFALKMRKESKEVIKQKVHEAAEILGLVPYLDRKPKDLSGGQRQRVALGRAIVRDSKIFLMDEPLSNLDAKLRGHMRTELLKIHRELGATTIYVSHDQIEAMTMATKIVVMNFGKIMQCGSPAELYENPQNKFVAGFIGNPTMNFFNGQVIGNKFIGEDNIELIVEKDYPQTDVILGIRPNKFKIADAGIPGVIEYIELIGHIIYLHVRIKEKMVILELEKKREYEVGENVFINADAKDIFVFDATSEERI